MTPALAAAVPGAVMAGMDLIGQIVTLGQRLSGGQITLGQYHEQVAAAAKTFDATVQSIDVRVAAIFAEGDAAIDALPERQPAAPAVVTPAATPPAAVPATSPASVVPATPASTPATPDPATPPGTPTP